MGMSDQARLQYEKILRDAVAECRAHDSLGLVVLEGPDKGRRVSAIAVALELLDASEEARQKAEARVAELMPYVASAEVREAGYRQETAIAEAQRDRLAAEASKAVYLAGVVGNQKAKFTHLLARFETVVDALKSMDEQFPLEVYAVSACEEARAALEVNDRGDDE